MATAGKRAAAAAFLSIGALSRASGIPVPTLRTWESRYGYPEAQRKPSGHRLYAASNVPRLRRMSAALAHGHRAGEVVTASDAALGEMLAMSQPPLAVAPVPIGGSGVDLPQLLAMVRAFDNRRLTRVLGNAWTRLGPLMFCRDCVAPLLVLVGEEWAAGRLEIRHEHFVSERLGDVLRSIRMPFEERAAGPLVVLATLPGEQHGLGLQMVALLLAVAGCRGCLLGTDLPVEQMAQIARDLRARALAVSVSEAASRRAAREQLLRLRAALPRRVTLLAGGRGAFGTVPGIAVMQDLDHVDGWARSLAASAQ